MEYFDYEYVCMYIYIYEAVPRGAPPVISSFITPSNLDISPT